jgi:nuclear autoantigenic sperm protein
MEACRLLAEEFGDLADECAEAYYYYGLALLENARHEGDVLGDAVEGGEKTEDDDEEDESEEEEKSGDDEEMESEENGEAASAGEEPKEKTETSDEKPVTNGKGKALKPPQPVQSAGEKTPEAEEVKDGNEAPEEEVEEASNDLQLAWEILELAKQIYERQAQKDPGANPRLADSLLRLAEVAIESENYTSAIEDLQKCLGIQTASLPADSRSLAETHYQLGVAYTFTTDFAEAIKSFEAAAAIIQQRLDNLK